MALVRRSEVLGTQAPEAATPPGATAGATAGETVGPTQAAPQQAVGEAAAVSSKPASFGSVLFAFVLVALGALGAYALNRWGTKAAPFKVGNQTSAYAGLAVFSAAVERFLEPFAQWLPGGRKAKAQLEKVTAALANRHPVVTLTDVADARARLDRALASRTVFMWGLATAVATVVAAAGGFYLLHMIAGPSWAGAIPNWVDALVTGLVVGTGTKPLHDLITKVQSQKNAATGQ
jgi:hypothetical protein